MPVSQRGVPAVRMSPKVVNLLKSHTRGSAISRATSEPLPDNISIAKDASEFGEWSKTLPWGLCMLHQPLQVSDFVSCDQSSCTSLALSHEDSFQSIEMHFGVKAVCILDMAWLLGSCNETSCLVADVSTDTQIHCSVVGPPGLHFQLDTCSSDFPASFGLHLVANSWPDRCEKLGFSSWLWCAIKYTKYIFSSLRCRCLLVHP